MKKIAVIGYSGHAYVVLDACEKAGIDVHYYCERNQLQYNPFHLEYAGYEESDNFNWDSLDAFVLGIGNNIIREKVAALIKSKGKSLFKVIHPTAVINNFVTIGEGSLVASNAVINPLSVLGDYCIVNTGAIIEHECTVGNTTHIAPGAVLAGNVTIGPGCFIGANAVIKEGITIGENVIIGAGSVVLKDVSSTDTWAGNPAKSIK